MADLEKLLENIEYALGDLNIPGFELNFNHYMEIQKGNEDCIFGFFWLCSYNSTGHAHIVLIPQIKKPIQEWPVAFYDDEHGTAYTFASSLKTWFSSYFIYQLNKWYPVYRRGEKISWVTDCYKALSKNKKKIISLGEKSDKNFASFFDEISEKVSKKEYLSPYELYKKIEPNSYLTQYYKLKEDDAKIGEWKKFINKNPHFNRPLYDLLLTENVNLDDEDPELDLDLCHTFWSRFLKVDIKYYKVLPAIVKRIMSEKKKWDSPFMPFIEKIYKVIKKDSNGYYHGTEGFFKVGKEFEKKKDYITAIQCYSNAIMMGRSETEEYHEESYDRIRECAQKVNDKNYLAYLSETEVSDEDD